MPTSAANRESSLSCAETKRTLRRSCSRKKTRRSLTPSTPRWHDCEPTAPTTKSSTTGSTTTISMPTRSPASPCLPKASRCGWRMSPPTLPLRSSRATSGTDWKWTCCANSPTTSTDPWTSGSTTSRRRLCLSKPTRPTSSPAACSLPPNDWRSSPSATPTTISTAPISQ